MPYVVYNTTTGDIRLMSSSPNQALPGENEVLTNHPYGIEQSHYVDVPSTDVKAKPAKPSEFSRWINKAWVEDAQALSDAKAFVSRAWDTWLSEKLSGKFTSGSEEFPADDRSYLAMLALAFEADLALRLPPFSVRKSDRTTKSVTLTATLKDILKAGSDYREGVRQQKWTAEDDVAAATTVAAVMALLPPA